MAADRQLANSLTDALDKAAHRPLKIPPDPIFHRLAPPQAPLFSGPHGEKRKFPRKLANKLSKGNGRRGQLPLYIRIVRQLTIPEAP